MFLLLTFLSLCQQDRVATVTAKPSRPNILYILADDLGYADVSWNNPAMVTPNLEALARKGVILDQFYTQVKIWQVLWWIRQRIQHHLWLGVNISKNIWHDIVLELYGAFQVLIRVNSSF